MTEINIESLINNGFEIELENKEAGTLWLRKSIKNWSICYRIYRNKLDEFIIEADGRRYSNGEFDLSHVKYIEQIVSLIDAMYGITPTENKRDKE